MTDSLRYPFDNPLFRDLWDRHCDRSEVDLMNKEEFAAAGQALLTLCLAACDEAMRRFNTDYYQPERMGALECKNAITQMSKNTLA